VRPGHEARKERELSLELLAFRCIEFGLGVLDGSNSSVSAEKPHSTGTIQGMGDPAPAVALDGAGARVTRKRKLPKTIPAHEVEAILGACNQRTPTGLRDRCMLELMYRAGLRIGEVRRLRTRDVDLGSGEVHVYDSKAGDGTAYFDKARVSPLLARWKDRRRAELSRRLGRVPRDAPLFCTIRTPAGQEISERTVQQMVKRRAQRAGVDETKVTPHRFRHSFATETLNETGITIYDVKELMRHASLRSTEVYLHVRDADLRAKIQRRSS
jgi:integrase/recombinase XerD